MVSKTRMKAVVERRILAARRRRDRSRINQLEAMLSLLNSGRATAGQILLDMQVYAKARLRVEPVVRRGHGPDSKERHGWKSDQHRKQPASGGLRGGL